MAERKSNGERAKAGLALLQDMALTLDKGVKGEVIARVNSLSDEEIKDLAAAHKFASHIGGLIAISPKGVAAHRAREAAEQMAPAKPKWPA